MAYQNLFVPGDCQTGLFCKPKIQLYKILCSSKLLFFNKCKNTLLFSISQLQYNIERLTWVSMEVWGGKVPLSKLIEIFGVTRIVPPSEPITLDISG